MDPITLPEPLYCPVVAAEYRARQALSSLFDLQYDWCLLRKCRRHQACSGPILAAKCQEGAIKSGAAAPGPSGEPALLPVCYHHEDAAGMDLLAQHVNYIEGLSCNGINGLLSPKGRRMLRTLMPEGQIIAEIRSDRRTAALARDGRVSSPDT